MEEGRKGCKQNDGRVYLIIRQLVLPWKKM